MATLVARIDGASRGNPGPAAYAVVIETAEGRRLETLSEAIGRATNNVAEYRGLIAALEYAVARQAHSLKVFSDSELLTRQVNGIYRIKSPDLRPLNERVRALAAQLDEFSIEHVRREWNQDADRLANQALDEARRGAP
jgi:ribonuclease HI